MEKTITYSVPGSTSYSIESVPGMKVSFANYDTIRYIYTVGGTVVYTTLEF